MAKQKTIIDVDRVIELYNKKNPGKLPMTRTRLAKECGVNKQLFSDWKGGKTPKWVSIIFKLMEIGDCWLHEFIIEEDEKR